MSLFDKFRKKPKASKSAPEAEAKEQAPALLHTDNGGHGDNFGGLLGFEYISTPEGNQRINELIALSVSYPPLIRQEDASLFQLAIIPEEPRLMIRSIVRDETLRSAFPFLQSEAIIPGNINTITEWSHVAGLEAEIAGAGRDTFGFGFFPTDYAVHKAKYHTTATVPLRISGLVLVLTTNEQESIGEHQLSDSFAGFFPSTDIPRPPYFDFIGPVSKVEPVMEQEELMGYIFRLKLINQEGDPDFFTIPAFVNKANMRMETIREGMRVSGLLWLMAELA